MTRRRIQRVNSLLREVISEAIRRDLKNIPIPELITITGVDTSNDLRHAKVFVSLIEEDFEKKEKLIVILNDAAGVISAIASKKVVLRYFPQLFFKLDESIEHYMQIDALLKEVEQKRSDTSGKDTRQDDSSDS